MQTLSAVVTTGIYCRAGCPARPEPRNVRRFGTSAAAEAAGFRACLRCRPYREAPVAWADGPELVCRAVQRILAGALDHGTEAELAARLGVSGRHLRRLFVAEVGATPDAVARSRRAHFARRLLDDTDLSVTDVAFAAGFGSVRQLNRACLDVFRAPPTALRARRRVADRLVADGGLRLRLPFRGPFELDALLRYLAARAVPGVESVDLATGTYRRTIVVGGDPGALELSAGGDDHLVLVAHLPHWEGLIHVVDRARRLFGLDLDVASATEALGRDPRIGRLVAERPGLRVPGAWDGFEAGVRAIIGQQVSVAGATTLAGRLVERLGSPVPGLRALGLSAVFPSPVGVADGDLEGLGLPAARVGAVRAFASAVAADEVRLDGSAGLDPLVRSLEALPGIGPWTAQYLALRLGERDAFPAGDLGLRRAHERLADGRPGPSLVAAAEAWRPWRALAAAHLWTWLGDT
ncbi:MAG TPA: AlkA N-terminal domain-containing protein [Acidimicrobiales bacterium]|nr:AlkA N-terminal domain-containing protein [Acidimicrobiales bacterium]